MKFKLVEPPEPTIADTPADDAVQPPAGEPSAKADPAARLAAATEQLTAEVATEAEQIEASLGELMAVLATSSTQECSTARPPGNFRPDRFGPGQR